jgi:hypothetical protein
MVSDINARHRTPRPSRHGHRCLNPACLMAMTCGVIPLEVRKATLRSMLAKAGLGLRFNEHIEGDGFCWER